MDRAANCCCRSPAANPLRIVKGSMRRIVFGIVGYAVGGLCLWLSSRSVDWEQASQALHAARFSDIGAGLSLFLADMTLRALRWRTILSFRTGVALSTALQALLVGFAANSILPARLGEFYRAHYLARLVGASGSSVLASIVIERLLDLAVVFCALALGLTLARGGDGANHDVLLRGAAIGIAAVLLLTVTVWTLSRRSAEELLRTLIARLPASVPIAERGGAMLASFAQALQCVRTRHFLFAALLTPPTWMIEAAAIWSVCRAVGLDLDWIGVLLLLGGVSLSTMVPTAPGYVGSYQMAFVIILSQFGVSSTLAVVAATAVQIYLIGGFTLIGLSVMATASLIPMVAAARSPPRER